MLKIKELIALKAYSNEQLTEIYGNETRTMIVRLFRIYNELSLAQLSELMNMNKTTIQYHLKILREKDIIYESRESSEDSRGSIPTKYFQLKYEILDFRKDYSTISKINDPRERLIAYSNYFQLLLAGVKDIKNQILFVEEAIERNLVLIAENKDKNLTDDLMEKLVDEILEVNPAYSTFSTNRKSFSLIRNQIPEIFREFEKIQQENKDDTTEGYEIIAISIPLIRLIESRLKNKKRNIEKK